MLCTSNFHGKSIIVLYTTFLLDILLYQLTFTFINFLIIIFLNRKATFHHILLTLWKWMWSIFIFFGQLERQFCNINNDALQWFVAFQAVLEESKKTFHLQIRSSIFLTAVLSSIKITKTLLICVIISKISVWVLNGYFLQLVMASHHVMVLGDLLNIMLQDVVYRDPK